MAATPARSARRLLPWAALSLVLGALAVLVALVRFDALPDPYPTHFGAGGQPDAFGERTYTRVLMPVAIGQVGALGVFAATLLVPARMPRMVHALGALGAVIGGGAAVESIAGNLDAGAVPPPWGIWVLLGATLAVCGWIAVESVRAGPQEGADVDRDHWTWGIIYANPDEPDVFVPKRTGVGVTINFGRPLGWVLLALILAPGIVITALVTLAT